MPMHEPPSKRHLRSPIRWSRQRRKSGPRECSRNWPGCKRSARESRREQKCLRRRPTAQMRTNELIMLTCSEVRFLFRLCCFAVLASLSTGASAQVRLLSEHLAERPARLDREWPAVLTHTHNWRFREGETAGSCGCGRSEEHTSELQS